MKSLSSHITETLSEVNIIESVTEEAVINEAADVAPYLDEVIAALPQLEALVKKHLGFKPKLSAVNQRNQILLTSTDLMSELGKTLAKSIFVDIQMYFWGGTVTSDGKSIWFNPKLSYSHPSGGSNGTDFLWDGLWWDLDKKQWIEGRIIVK